MYVTPLFAWPPGGPPSYPDDAATESPCYITPMKALDGSNYDTFIVSDLVGGWVGGTIIKIPPIMHARAHAEGIIMQNCRVKYYHGTTEGELRLRGISAWR